MKKAAKLSTIILSILLIISCNKSTEKARKNNTKDIEVMTKKNEEIVNVALIYLKDGEEARFEEYKKKGGAILKQYGGKIERIIKPTMLAKGEIELPNEIHFASYPSIDAFNDFNKDEEFIKIRNEYALPALKNISVFTSKNTDFEFKKETGDTSKTYGVALLYFNNGKESLFEEYHEGACEIMPEFGAHFERFIAPFEYKGSVEMPNEIHRFYFDSMDGLQQMGTDERMQALFPKRDASLSNLLFFIGEATI